MKKIAIKTSLYRFGEKFTRKPKLMVDVKNGLLTPKMNTVLDFNYPIARASQHQDF